MATVIAQTGISGSIRRDHSAATKFATRRAGRRLAVRRREDITDTFQRAGHGGHRTGKTSSSRRIYMRQKSASMSPGATQIPSTGAIEKMSSETIRAASQTFITPVAAKPHLASAPASAEEEEDSAPPERLDVSRYNAEVAAAPTRISQRAASKPAAAQRHQQPIRWEVLEADLAAPSKTAIDTSSKLADVKPSRGAFVEDSPVKFRPNPVREPALTAMNRSGAKNESQPRTHFHAIRPAHAQLPIKAEAVNPLRLGASSKRTEVRVADINPLRR
jgi:hypothetical protein